MWISNVWIRKFFHIYTNIMFQTIRTKEITNKSVYKTELVNDRSDRRCRSFFPQQPDENLAKRSFCGLSQIARFPLRNCWRLDKFITEWIVRPPLMFVVQFILLRFSSLYEKDVQPLNVIPSMLSMSIHAVSSLAAVNERDAIVDID